MGQNVESSIKKAFKKQFKTKLGRPVVVQKEKGGWYVLYNGGVWRAYREDHGGEKITFKNIRPEDKS